jgi:hypothetical protein
MGMFKDMFRLTPPGAGVEEEPSDAEHGGAGQAGSDQLEAFNRQQAGQIRPA